jgi:CubicO group peptidase (beta-lactamase class C family)
MKRIVAAFIVLLAIAACAPKANWAPADANPEGVYPDEVWQKATTPEELGWSSEKLAAARAYSERIGSAAVMIVDDGIVVDAWGDTTRKYQCHSIRKSLLSALIGIHVEEGHIDLSKTLEELGIDDTEPSLTATEKQATIADLIKARSGIYHAALGEANSMKANRPERHSHTPGTFWFYNNWDFNALGTIFEKETGTRIFEEFDRRIAQPLQMEDFEVSDCGYLAGNDYGAPKVSIHPYYRFCMSARDLARFGLLFLREGRWHDQQIIPADWVRESTATHSETGPDSGYGYMWWNGVQGGLLPNVRVKEHSFYASGYRGHRVIVLPYRNLVIVHRVDTDSGNVNIGGREIGPLLWLILDAAGETDIGDAPLLEIAQGIRVTAENLHETWGEATIWYFDGPEEQYITSHAPDSTMTFTARESGELVDTGRWWAEGGKVCRQWKELEGGEKACFYVVLDDTTLQWFDLDGILAGKVDFFRK